MVLFKVLKISRCWQEERTWLVVLQQIRIAHQFNCVESPKGTRFLSVQVKVFFFNCLVSRTGIMHRFISGEEAFVKSCLQSHLCLSELKCLLQDPLTVHFEALSYLILEVHSVQKSTVAE